MCSGDTENTQKVLRVKMTKHRVFRQETLSAVTKPVVGDMVLRAVVFVLADMALSSGFPERLGQGSGCHLSAALALGRAASMSVQASFPPLARSFLLQTLTLGPQGKETALSQAGGDRYILSSSSAHHRLRVLVSSDKLASTGRSCNSW